MRGLLPRLLAFAFACTTVVASDGFVALRHAEATLPPPSGARSPFPLNHNFSTGLSNWSPTGTVSTGAVPAYQSDPASGDYSVGDANCSGAKPANTGQGVRLQGSASIQSDTTFTIPTDARRMLFTFSTEGNFPSISVNLVISGVSHPLFNPTFAGSPYEKSFSTACDVSAYAGQNATIRISSSAGGNVWILNGGVTSGLGMFRFVDESLDPVSLVSGVLSHEHTDLAIPGRGIPLAFTRTYLSSSATVNGDLGYGWAHNYSTRLQIYTNGSVEVVSPVGARAFYTNNGGTLTAPAGVFDTLVKNGDNTYTLTTTAQIRNEFDATGRLTALKDRNDNMTSLTYDANGISTVTSPGGRQLVFTVNATSKRITQVTDPLNRTVQFGYDSEGDLTTVTDTKNGVTTFTYVLKIPSGSSHRLATITNALNKLQVTNTYDNADRVIKQVDATNGVTCFYYGTGPANQESGCPGVTPSPVAGQTYMVNPRGFKELHQFDMTFRPTGIENHLGQDVIYTYESGGSDCYAAGDNGNLCSIADPLGHATSFLYDVKGNVTKVTDGLGHAWQYSYTSLNDVDVITDPRLNTTEYNYTSGNLTSIVDALSKTTSLGYNDPTNPGLVTSVTDPLTHATSFTYDTYGNLLTVRDALNNTVSYTYDLGGRVLSATDAMSPARTTTFTYDNQNNLLTVEDPLNGAAAKTEYTYDAVGNRKTMKNPRGYTTNYDYFDDSRLKKVTEPPIGAAAGRATQYTYDANGNLATLKDQRRETTANSVAYTYDAADRLTKIAYPDVHYVTEFTYDAAGRRQTMTDTRGVCNASGPVTCPPGAIESDTTTYGYDDASRLTSVETTFGGAAKTVGYAYDEANNRTSVKYADGYPNRVVTYTYDALNRMNAVTASWRTGPLATYNYDDAGRLTSTLLAASTGITGTYGYDSADRLTSVTNTKAGAPPTVLSSFEYLLNPNGIRTQVTDISGVTGYGYDLLDRLTSADYPGAPITAYQYDGAGNRTSVQADANPATAYTYDEADQLKTIDGVTNTFDKNGSLLTIGTGLSLANTFLYDQENRLFRTGPCRADVNGDGNVNVTDGGRISAHFGIEGSGNYDLLVDPNADLGINVIDLFISGSNGEFGKNCKSTGANTGNARYWYNGDGLRMRERTFPDLPDPQPDVRDTYNVWDAGASLPVMLEQTVTEGSTTAGFIYVYGLDLVARFNANNTSDTYYLYDGLGSVRGLADGNGNASAPYDYDVYGAVKTAPAHSNPFRFTGEQQDSAANRGLIYLRARHYDPALGRFLQKDPLPLLNRYAYAGNSPANYVDPSGLFPPCPGCGKLREGAGLVGSAASATVGGVGSAIAWADAHGVDCLFEGPICSMQEIVLPGLASLATQAACLADKESYFDAGLNIPNPWVAGTVIAGGGQVSCSAGLHPYIGAGVGGPGPSFTVAPNQRIAEGAACGASLGVGQGGLAGGTNSPGPYGELGYASPSYTCIYVLPRLGGLRR